MAKKNKSLLESIGKIETTEEFFRVFEEKKTIYQESTDKWLVCREKLKELPVVKKPSGCLRICSLIVGVALYFYKPILSLVAAVCFVFLYIMDKKKQKKYEEYRSKREPIESAMKKEKKVQNEIENFLKEMVIYGFQVIQNIPIPSDSITKKNYYEKYNQLSEIGEIERKIGEETDRLKQFNLRKRLIDSKLKYFYENVILRENDSDVVECFREQLKEAEKQGNYDMLRCENSRNSNKGFRYVNSIPLYKAQLKDNRMESYIQQFNNTLNMDISGIIRSVDKDKLAEQTKIMHGLVQVAHAEYAEMADLCKKVKVALNYARTCAYRNIYLGSEAVTFVSRLTGVDDNRIEKEDLKLLDIEIPDANISITGIEADISSLAINTAFNKLGTSLEYLMSSRQTRKYAKENPKTALGLAAASAIGSAIQVANEERNRVIEQNQNIQCELVNDFQRIIDNYADCQAKLMRAIELVSEIRRANDGFMTMYTNLHPIMFNRDKMMALGSVEVIAMKKDLLEAAQQYKRINTAKL